MYFLGIDIGSTTSKCIILNENKEICAKVCIRAGTGTKGPEQAFETALKDANVQQSDITCITATGYGRNNFTAAQNRLSELSCHAKGVHFSFPEVRTIIDIGGQDAKAISVDERGKMTNFVMNDKCAAGTGRFLDVMASILQLQVQDFEICAAKAQNILAISNTCTVFAESEVISQLSNGANINDLIAGICASVAGRVASLARRVGIEEKVCMSGGVAKNGGVRSAMEKELGTRILYSEDAQLMGALGAALYGQEQNI